MNPFLKSFEPVDVSCDALCESKRIQLQKLLLVIEATAMKKQWRLGSILRHYSSKIGILFKNSYFSSNDRLTKSCEEVTSVEQKIHQVMKTLGLSIGINVSLHDIPNFYKVSTSARINPERLKDQPLFSLCTSGWNWGITLPYCPSSWYTNSANIET